jgi:hypothetical protein
MAREILSLTPQFRGIYYGGLDREDRNELSVFFQNLHEFRPISELLNESRRCIEKAGAPNGSVAVTGKALDLLIKSFFPDVKGTLGQMLHSLKRRKESDKKLKSIANEILLTTPFLESRNAGAHFIRAKPDISLREARQFLEKVEGFVKYEQDQAEMIFVHLRKD